MTITEEVAHLARITLRNLFARAVINRFAIWRVGNGTDGERPENSRNIQSLASLFKKGAGGVPLIVMDVASRFKFELLSNSVDAFEFGKIRNDVRLSVYRTESSRPYKPGRACTDAFDGPRFEGRFLYEDTGKGIVRHNSPLEVGREETTSIYDVGAEAEA